MGSRRTYATDDLVTFLTAVDGELAATARVVLIGGGAAALGYGVALTTKDLDIYDSRGVSREVVLAAREATGLDIPLDSAAVADLPYDYEDRLIRVLPELSRLEVLVVDRLVTRFVTEMTHVIGNPRTIELNFLQCVEALFGELAVARAEARLRSR